MAHTDVVRCEAHGLAITIAGNAGSDSAQVPLTFTGPTTFYVVVPGSGTRLVITITSASPTSNDAITYIGSGSSSQHVPMPASADTPAGRAAEESQPISTVTEVQRLPNSTLASVSRMGIVETLESTVSAVGTLHEPKEDTLCSTLPTARPPFGAQASFLDVGLSASNHLHSRNSAERFAARVRPRVLIHDESPSEVEMTAGSDDPDQERSTAAPRDADEDAEYEPMDTMFQDVDDATRGDIKSERRFLKRIIGHNFYVWKETKSTRECRERNNELAILIGLPPTDEPEMRCINWEVCEANKVMDDIIDLQCQIWDAADDMEDGLVFLRKRGVEWTKLTNTYGKMHRAATQMRQQLEEMTGTRFTRKRKAEFDSEDEEDEKDEAVKRARLYDEEEGSEEDSDGGDEGDPASKAG
ncbi:hypothetical protein BDZ85DRAFT_38060 [Elsinoe ampelina]|uniref:Uncharacterized protein n=1 Tax=Elsinoe ampelina TaxID=302913 RepID=A0A6A6G2T2_9PEZI|nr:hypothetical protein BDZ85DRAFT_38060 [Elsinoe ampelina]